MRALYDARLEDLGPGDLVQIDCLACGHTEVLTAMMPKTAGVAPYATVVELRRRFRCRQCDEYGRVHISIRWAET